VLAVGILATAHLVRGRQSQNNKKERLLRRYHSSQRLAIGTSAKLELIIFAVCYVK